MPEATISEDVPAPAAMPTAAAPTDRYTSVAIAFHWAIALCIVGQIALGWRLHAIAGPAKFAAYQLHKSIGLTILVLSVGRLAWRLLNPPPREIPLPRWQMLASHAVHTGLYAIMIGLPLTGWLMVSTSRITVPTRVFGILPWPAIPGTATLDAGAKQVWNTLGDRGHFVLVWLTIALLVLHLGAVAKHQLIDRDRVFARMAPGARPGVADWRFWTIVALAIAAVAFGRTVMSGSGSRAAVRGDTAVAASPSMPAVVAPPPPPVAGSAPPAAETAAPLPTADTDIAPAAPRTWTMRSGTLGFAADWAGDSVTGSFAKWTADIMFSPDALDRSTIAVRVDLTSVATGDVQRDGALPTADWFDAATHRYAVYTSRRIRRDGAGYAAEGTLDLRGIKRPVTVPFTVVITGDRATARGSLKIDRTAFGVGQGEWAATDQLAADVALKFSLAATAPASAAR